MNLPNFDAFFVLYVRRGDTLLGFFCHPNRLACEEKAKEMSAMTFDPIPIPVSCEIVEYVRAATLN